MLSLLLLVYCIVACCPKEDVATLSEMFDISGSFGQLYDWSSGVKGERHFSSENEK